MRRAREWAIEKETERTHLELTLINKKKIELANDRLESLLFFGVYWHFTITLYAIISHIKQKEKRTKRKKNSVDCIGINSKMPYTKCWIYLYRAVHLLRCFNGFLCMHTQIQYTIYRVPVRVSAKKKICFSTRVQLLLSSAGDLYGMHRYLSTVLHRTLPKHAYHHIFAGCVEPKQQSPNLCIDLSTLISAVDGYSRHCRCARSFIRIALLCYNGPSLVWHGMAWHGSARLGSTQFNSRHSAVIVFATLHSKLYKCGIIVGIFCTPTNWPM